MAFTVTTLMENTSPRAELAAEHGLSLLIEGGGRRILYDAGPSPRFLLNARAMGVSLDGLDALVISHSHYDHTGGAAALLARPEKPAAIYVGWEFFTPRFGRREDGRYCEVGSVLEQCAITAAKVPCRVVGSEPVALGNGVWLVSGFDSLEDMEMPTDAMVRKTEAGLEADPFTEELAVVLELQEGLALISGCSHTGVVSMCRALQNRFGRPVTVFVGGTHLMGADSDRIRRTCLRLRELGVKQLGACHCSGEAACTHFEANFPGFFRNNVGTRLVLE